MYNGTNMNWIATNIRFSEDQYMKLKIKAAKERKSVAAILRDAAFQVTEIESIHEDKSTKADKLIKELKALAKDNAKQAAKNFNWVKALREIRYKE